MLTMDVTKLSHAELAEAVSQRCSEFGGVREVTILQPPEKPQIAFALVGMTADHEIDRVVDELGAARVASLAVIRIEQEKPPISQSVFSRKLQPDWAALV
jgi:hypothetical protein